MSKEILGVICFILLKNAIFLFFLLTPAYAAASLLFVNSYNCLDPGLTVDKNSIINGNTVRSVSEDSLTLIDIGDKGDRLTIFLVSINNATQSANAIDFVRSSWDYLNDHHSINKKVMVTFGFPRSDAEFNALSDLGVVNVLRKEISLDLENYQGVWVNTGYHEVNSSGMIVGFDFIIKSRNKNIISINQPVYFIYIDSKYKESDFGKCLTENKLIVR